MRGRISCIYEHSESDCSDSDTVCLASDHPCSDGVRACEMLKGRCASVGGCTSLRPDACTLAIE